METGTQEVEFMILPVYVEIGRTELKVILGVRVEIVRERVDNMMLAVC